jgi:hypothetical protein
MNVKLSRILQSTYKFRFNADHYVHWTNMIIHSCYKYININAVTGYCNYSTQQLSP